MLKTHMTACLMATALVTAAAFAQGTTAPSSDRPAATGSGSTTSGSPAMQPGGTGGASGTTASGDTGMGSGTGASGSSTVGAGTGSSGGSAGSATSGMSAGAKPLAGPQPGQIMGSDLRGTRVYGSNNESIGDISDLLLDRQGRIVAAIVGVGGFLGIGQKDVAVPFEALEIVPQGAAGSGSGSGTGSGGGGSGGPATTGATGTAGSGAGGSGTMNPDRIVLRGMTRTDLDAAPAFRSDGGSSGSGASGSGSSGTSGSGSAPRQ